MATIGMNYAVIYGAREMRLQTLQTLLQFGALELHRRTAVGGRQAERHALVRLFEQVQHYAKSRHPAHAPGREPQDLTGLASRLLDETDLMLSERHRLVAIADRQRVWGNTSPTQLAALADAGVFIQCWRTDDLASIDKLAAGGQVLWRGAADKKGVCLFCTVSRDTPLVTDWAANVAPPSADPEQLRDQTGAVEARLEVLRGALCWLARERLEQFGEQIASQIDALSIEAGRAQSHADEHIFVLSGWVPVTRVDEAVAAIDKLPAVNINVRYPAVGEDPPTLSRYPAWASPIQSLFEFMGYRPGYYEYDAGHLIILFFTLFSALLINDGGYGAVMLGVLLLGRRRLTGLLGSGAVHLGLYVAIATLIYGALTGALFGIKFNSVAGVNFLAPDTTDMIRVSFGLGIVHLSLGRLIQLARHGWKAAALGELGWLSIIWAIFLGILNVFTGGEVPAISGPLLAAGAAMVVLFSRTELGWLRGPLMGLGLLIGNATTVFSDVMSYIRIMAVGFASMSLAMTTNLIAEQTGSLFFGAIILVIGHGINLGLGIIALFVHGLRLNTLEFARQLGVIWSGHAFEPMAHFDLRTIEER